MYLSDLCHLSFQVLVEAYYQVGYQREIGKYLIDREWLYVDSALDFESVGHGFDPRSGCTLAIHSFFSQRSLSDA